MRRWTAALLGFLLVLASAACGDDGGEDAEEATTDQADGGEGDDAGDDGGDGGDGGGGTDGGEEDSGACLILTADDVTEVLPDAGEIRQESGSPLSCTYGAGEGVQATLTLQPDALAEASFDDAVAPLTEFQGAEPEPVEGLGDSAVSVSQPLPLLLIGVGDDLVSISVITDGDSNEAQVQLAERVLERL